MIFQKQKFSHKPEEGIYGDCHRTALACLLDVDRDSVPHIGEEHWNDGAKFQKHFDDYLESQGYFMVDHYYTASLHEVLKMQQACNEGALYILAGCSSNQVNHSVIACGDKIIWDPSLTGSGIIAPMVGLFDSDGNEINAYCVSYLIPLSMRFSDEIKSSNQSRHIDPIRASD